MKKYIVLVLLLFLGAGVYARLNYRPEIYDESKDMPTKVQSSNLNEELGQLSYIFTDKTGTLT